MGSRYTAQLVKHVTTNLQYLEAWEQGIHALKDQTTELRKENNPNNPKPILSAQQLSKNLNFLELSFYHVGLSENLKIRPKTFRDLLRTEQGPQIIDYNIKTGRSNYAEIKHDWQKPLIHKKSTPPTLWKEVLATNPYDKETLYQRLLVTGAEIKNHAKALKEQYWKILIPGPGVDLELPIKREYGRRTAYYKKSDYKSVLEEVAKQISQELQTYHEPHLDNNAMNKKIVMYKQEHPNNPQLLIGAAKNTRKHQGISQIYEEPTPYERKKGYTDEGQLGFVFTK